MPRISKKIRPKVIETKSSLITFPHKQTIKSYLIWQFFCYHKEPNRAPIVNKIRKAIYEQGIDYTQMSKLYNLTERRISDTLSYKFENIVLDILATHYKISANTSYDDYIANYDFEQKEISHQSGRRTEHSKQEFISEFNKSWSQETISYYKSEMEDLLNEQDEFAYEEQIGHMEDKKKKQAFSKLLRIYDEYPDIVQNFCDSFIEDTTE